MVPRIQSSSHSSTPEGTLPPGPPERRLRALVVSGFAWSLGSGVVVQVSRVIFAIGLARFLTPHDYGLAAMALVVSTFIFAFTDLSLGAGLVQRAEITEEDRSTVFWTNAAVGVLLTFAGVMLSGAVAGFYGEPEVQPLFAILSLTFVVGSIGATHAALLQREMDFRSISIRVGASTIIGGASGVVLAAAGFGAWAIVVQQFCTAIVSTVLLWISMPWRPRLVYSRRSLRELGAYGGSLFGMRVSDYARVTAERLLIGRVLGSAALGTYSLAFNVLLSPVGRFLIAIVDTLFPALSRLQDEPDRLASVWLRVNRVFSAAFVPAVLGLALVAPEFVSVVLGEQWADAAPVLQVLAIGVIMQVVSALGADVLKAIGRARTLLWFSSIEAFAFLLSAVFGLQWGILGVAAAYSLVNVVSRGYFIWLAADSIAMPVGRFFSSLAGVVQASVALFGATVCARVLLADAPLPAWLRLGVLVALGIAAYVPVCLWKVPEMRAELALLRRDGLRGRQPAVAEVWNP